MRPCYSVLLFILVFLNAHTSHAQETRWYDGFYANVSVLHYFTPEVLSELVLPKTGFRAGLGYELNRFLFTIESGYSRIEGTNPLVTEINIAPLFFKFGYNLPIKFGIGVQAEAGAGFIFSRTSRYETAIDIVLGNLRTDKVTSFFLPARLYVTWTPGGINQFWSFLKIYIGGGADIVFENDGPIPMPVIEAGVSIKPFAIKSRKRAFKDSGYSEESYIPEIEQEEIVFLSLSENIIIEETEEGKSVRLLNAVYFIADSAVMIERYRHVLDEAGRQLGADPDLHVTLRAYTAPFGTAQGRLEISEARARFCAQYLSDNWGIARERIKTEHYGAERVPEFAGANWESYRCVELIIEKGNL